MATKIVNLEHDDESGAWAVVIHEPDMGLSITVRGSSEPEYSEDDFAEYERLFGTPEQKAELEKPSSGAPTQSLLEDLLAAMKQP